jgi:hypothetical protein
VSTSSASALAPAILILVLFVAILARRTYAMVRGTRYSAGRIFGFTGVYVLLFAALAFPTLYAAIDAWGGYGELLLAPYVVVPVLAAAVAAPYVRRIVRFEQRDAGTWYYQLPWLVPVLYLGLFVLRFLLETLLFGLAVVPSFYLPTSVPTGLLLLLVGVDLLFGVSTGLLLGRSIGVYRGYQDLSSPEGGASGAPLPHGGPP